MRRFLSFTALLFFTWFCCVFLSCASRIEGSLASDGSALMSVNIRLEPRMTTLIRSLSRAGGQSNGPVLDGPAIARSMSSAPGVASASLGNTSEAAIEGQVRISQIGEFLSAAETGRNVRRGFITFEQTAAGGRCNININRQNGPAILELLSPEISDYLNALMAPLATGEELNKTEYLNLVASFYNRTISDEIAYSRIRASIDFPGNITSVRGGTYSGRRAEFDIPLLDLLVAETPLIYEVTWN
ncbi:MAG: hypothetical protein FWC06_00775 [Treponema sp.]|nr:hypothetical protein [Treponema sp.]